jgi:hypothetical protein
MILSSDDSSVRWLGAQLTSRQTALPAAVWSIDLSPMGRTLSFLSLFALFVLCSDDFTVTLCITRSCVFAGGGVERWLDRRASSGDTLCLLLIVRKSV